MKTQVREGAARMNADLMQNARLLLLVIVSSTMGGCRANVEADTPQMDSVVVDSAVLREPPMPAAASAGTISDSTVVQQSSADIAAVVDSLRAQVTRLDAQVTRLQTVDQNEPLNLLGDAQVNQGNQSEGLDAARRVQETAQDVRHFTFRAIWAAILFVVSWIGIKGAEWLLNVLSERSAKRRLLFKKLIPIVRLLVWALAVFYVVSSVFEIDRAGLLAGTAALGVGIGFAAQGVLKNVFGGLIIIFDQPFQVGDKIKVGGTYGEVLSIGMRATRIVTPDDNLVSVPNAQIIEDQVANANAGNLDCQVVVDLYLPGWTDVAKAKEIARNAAINSQYTYLDKPIVVNVKDEFDRIFLTHLVVKAYVIDTRHEFALASDITQAAKEEFLRHGMITVMSIDPEMIDVEQKQPNVEPKA